MEFRRLARTLLVVTMSLGLSAAMAPFAAAEVIVTADAVPGAPTDVIATSGTQQVALSWTAPVVATPDITDYVIQYRTTAGPGSWNTFTDGTSTGTSATVTSLTGGTAYDFQVAAINSVGTGAYSTSASATPIAVPGAPGVSSSAGLKIVVDNDFALLAGDSTNATRLIYNNDYSWPDQVSNAATLQISLTSSETHLYLIPMGGGGTEDFGGTLGGVDVTGVTGAQRATGGDSGYLTIQGSLVSYNSGAVANGTYSVALGDVRTGLTAASWGSAVATGEGDGIPPLYKTSGVGATASGQTGRAWGFPSDKAVAFRYPVSAIALPPVPGDSQVQVYWSTPSSDGGSAITDYQVQYRTTDGPGSWGTFADGTSTNTSTTVTGLTNGTSYDFRIAAINAAGTGGYSSTLTATPKTVPGVPQALTTTLSGTQAAMSWSAPTSNGGASISDYAVQYRTTVGPGAWNTFADGTSTSTTATITGLTNGTSYDFHVAAVNSVGTGSYASPVTPVWGTTIPGVPLSLSATPGDALVSLAWSGPASTGGTAITDYIVEYRTGSNPWTTFSDGVSTSRSASVTGLTNGTAYDFRVTAVNANGPGSATGAVTSTPAAAAAPAPAPGGAPAPTPAPTTNPTPTPSPTTPIDPSVALAPVNANALVPLQAPLPQGGTVVVVGNAAREVTVTPVPVGTSPRLRALRIAGDGFTMGLFSVLANGRVAPLRAGMSLVLVSRQSPPQRLGRRAAGAGQPLVGLSGTGFQPDTEVLVFLLPDVRIGAVSVDGSGNFSGRVPITAGLAPGSYTLQANGFTADGVIRSVSTGVQVVAESTTKKAARETVTAVVHFAPGSSVLSRTERLRLQALAKKYGSRATTTSVDGYVQKDGSTHNDKSLSLARARTVAGFLKEHGLSGSVKVTGRGRASESGSSARRVEVRLTYRVR